MYQEANTYIDIGFAVRQKMSEQDISIAWLARRVNCDRSNLGKQLQNKHIYPELLLKISVALKTNFFELYSLYCQHLFENKEDNAMR